MSSAGHGGPVTVKGNFNHSGGGGAVGVFLCLPSASIAANPGPHPGSKLYPSRSMSRAKCTATSSAVVSS